MRFTYANAKSFMCLSVVLIFSAMASYCYADSASVKIKGLADGEVDVIIHNISDDQIAQNNLITWGGIIAGTTGWKKANQYIEISHSDLPSFWGIQIYTDNKDASADPRYTGSSNPAGLIKTDNTIFSIPMAWRITDHVLTNKERQKELNNLQERADGKGMSDYLWRFFKDKNTPDNPDTVADESFQDGDDSVTLWNQAGIGWNEGGRSGNPKKAYIYLAANFTMSSVGAVYRTSALTIESYDDVSPFPIYLYKDAPLTEYPEEPGATLENHFAPSGWMNSKSQLSVDPKCKEVAPYSGAHSFKINWDGRFEWGGIVWLEPKDIWEYSGASPTHNGYDLRGADYLSFWAKTNPANTGLQIKAYFGNMWDSCGQTPPTWRAHLTNQWQQYIIPVLNRDMSNVTGGLAVVFDAAHDPAPDGCVIYLDDIKFDRY